MSSHVVDVEAHDLAAVVDSEGYGYQGVRKINDRDDAIV